MGKRHRPQQHRIDAAKTAVVPPTPRAIASTAATEAGLAPQRSQRVAHVSHASDDWPRAAAHRRRFVAGHGSARQPPRRNASSEIRPAQARAARRSIRRAQAPRGALEVERQLLDDAGSSTAGEDRRRPGGGLSSTRAAQARSSSVISRMALTNVSQVDRCAASTLRPAAVNV